MTARSVVDLLSEQSSRYAGRTSNETERLRGAVLASFETAGLPPDAVAFVLEELETGRNPSTVAAAGRALRGAEPLPAEAPGLLVAAIARLQGSDDVVRLEGFPQTTPNGAAVTALSDLASTLAALGPRAKQAIPGLRALITREGYSSSVHAELVTAMDALTAPRSTIDSCCHGDPMDVESPGPGAAPPGPATSIRVELGDLALENQDGERLTFAEAFAGLPTALAFFYTRCMNPEKCSLTVTRLARLARLMADNGFDANVAGMSYDPRFDRPGRLKTYGSDRGMIFSSRCSLLRTCGPFDPVQDAFALGVGFGPVTVNRHRLDVVVLDGSLRVEKTFERRLWHEVEVFRALRDAAA